MLRGRRSLSPSFMTNPNFLEQQRQNNRRTQTHQYHRRKWKGFFPPNQSCLPGITRGKDRWETIIEELCSYYNSFHAVKSKNCSVLTSKKRKSFYREFFQAINDQFGADPRNLKPKHIHWFLNEKIQARKESEEPHGSIVRYVENAVSMLKFFELWIGKKGMVRSSGAYLTLLAPDVVRGKPPMSRNTVMNSEQIFDVLKRAFTRDLMFGIQLLAMAAFGLRDKEVCGLDPHHCIHLKQYLHRDLDALGKVEIKAKSGSKGGRPRTILLHEETQVMCAQIIQQFASINGLRTLKSNEDNLETATRKLITNARSCGICNADFNGSVYSFRHSFAQTFLRAVAEADVSFKKLSAEEMHESVSLALGHYRKDVTGVYAGGFEPVGKEAAQGLVKRLSHPLATLSSAPTLLLCWLREYFQIDSKGAVFMLIWFLNKDGQIHNPALLGFLNYYEIQKKATPSSDYLIERCVKAFGLSRDLYRDILVKYEGCLKEEFVEKQLLTPYITKLFYKHFSLKQIIDDDTFNEQAKE